MAGGLAGSDGAAVSLGGIDGSTGDSEGDAGASDAVGAAGLAQATSSAARGMEAAGRSFMRPRITGCVGGTHRPRAGELGPSSDLAARARQDGAVRGTWRTKVVMP